MGSGWSSKYGFKAIQIIMNGIILAGGKGTRMAEMTEIPKVLLPVNGIPIIEHSIANLVDRGVSKIFITISRGSSELESWIRSSVYSDIIEIVRDIETVNGNSYGIIEAMKVSPDTTFLAFGDTIFNFSISDMLSFHLNEKNAITMLVRKTDHPEDSDLAWYSSRGLELSKYPHNFIDFTNKFGVSAFYILAPYVLNRISHSDFPDWFTIVQQIKRIKKKIGIFELKNGFISDLGTPNRYTKFIINSKNDYF